MKQFAIIIDGIVENVIVADSLESAISHTGLDCVEITESTGRPNIGCQYSDSLNKFAELKPFTSWILNSEFEWNAPTEYPSDGKYYYWNEPSLEWLEGNQAASGL